MTVYHPKKTDRILHNPGCGMLYLQRGFHKLPYSALPADSWFLRERLSDKIAIHLPWSARMASSARRFFGSGKY
mgnify:CR=1 FL=1